MLRDAKLVMHTWTMGCASVVYVCNRGRRSCRRDHPNRNREGRARGLGGRDAVPRRGGLRGEYVPGNLVSDARDLVQRSQPSLHTAPVAPRVALILCLLHRHDDACIGIFAIGRCASAGALNAHGLACAYSMPPMPLAPSTLCPSPGGPSRRMAQSNPLQSPACRKAVGARGYE